jgi:16S rRNA (uracil1498-N3)-methyltransferase
MAHLYISETLTASDDIAVISGPEARHAASVSRLRVGESISVTNGRGLVITGNAVTVSSDRIEVRIETRREDASESPTISLVQALAKGDRDELAIQMATELGVDSVYPWSASRSISVWSGPKVAKGVERWTSIVREASKQAMRSRIPAVSEPVTVNHISAMATTHQVLVLDPTGSEALTAIELYDAPLVVVVGPEGGISPQELQQLSDSGAHIVRLGPTVVRTSTAGAAAISVLNSRLGRWA